MSKIKPGTLVKVVKNSTILPTGKGNDELVELFYGEHCVPAIILNKGTDDDLIKLGSFEETEMHKLGDVLGMPIETMGIAVKEIGINMNSGETDEEIAGQATVASVSSRMNTIQRTLYKLVIKCRSAVKRAWKKELNKIMESDRPPKPNIKKTMWLVLINDNQTVIESMKKSHGGIMNTGSIRTGMYLIDPGRLELAFK